MKRLVLFILVLSILLFSACSAPNPSENSEPSVEDGVGCLEFIDSSQTDSEKHSEGEDPKKTGPEFAETPDRNENDEGNNSSDMLQEPGKDSSAKQQVNGSQSDASITKTETQVPVATDQKKPSSDSAAEPVQPQAPNAGASDTQAVADRVIAYINQYRAEQGSSAAVKLSGLTRYAQYRSEQLVSNFAHDTGDARAAATALQYGEYIDPALYGTQGEPYYRVNSRGAIAKAGYSGSVDYVAQSLAKLVRDSTGHWAYVGASKYCYIAVGVTYQGGMWYCDIEVSDENTDG